ncbi:hypothetical protein DM30_15355 [Brucella abortus]|nr:hypothetical protein DM30_15355 [Brucella abortus]
MTATAKGQAVVKIRAHSEKCETVFGKDARQNKGLERRSDSIRSKHALNITAERVTRSKLTAIALRGGAMVEAFRYDIALAATL